MSTAIDISLSITNNTNQPQEISVLGSVYNPRDTANARTEYKWNVTGFVFTSENGVTLLYKAINDASFSVFTTTLPAQTTQAVADALNTLGIGYFYTYIELGQTYIATYNDSYIFGELNIFTSSIVDSSFFYGTGFSNGFFSCLTGSSYTVGGGQLFIVGQFSSYNGNTSPNGIVLLQNDASRDISFISGGVNTNQIINSIYANNSGYFLVGAFTAYNGQSRNNVVKINFDGTIDTSFNVGNGITKLPLSATGYTVTGQSDGKILIGGDFTAYNFVTLTNIVRTNTDGSIDGTFSTLLDDIVQSILVQPNGQIIIAGSFTNCNGTSSNYIARLNTDGSTDTTFNVGVGFDAISSVLAIQSDGKILVGGFFTSYNGTTINRLIRLNTDGSIDSTFNIGTGFDSAVYAIAIEANGSIIVGGTFTSFNGIPANRIIRLTANGTIDTTWNYGTGFNNDVRSINFNANKSAVVVTGDFTTFNGISANRIIRLLI